MRAGFIGYRNFAGRLMGLFQETGRVREFLFYHPEKALEGVTFTNSFRDIYDCDFVVIASPDITHGTYLRRLADYGGYIFCEKIPVTDRADLIFLKSHRSPRLYFNFNLRKSILCDILRQKGEKTLYISHRMGHGFALRPEYAVGWRSSAHWAPLGVFQLSGIHFFDLLVYCFGRPSDRRITCRTLSPYGDSVDNFGMSMRFEGGPTADMFFSYTCPFQYKLDVITTEELIEYDGREFAIRGPRETFNDDGLFAGPPVITSIMADVFGDSLKNSVKYFLDVAESGGDFVEASEGRDLLSTELFLEVLDETGRRRGEHDIQNEKLKQH